MRPRRINRLLRERLPNAERVLGERAPAVIRAMSNMGCSLYETGECDEAEVWLQRSRRLGIESFGRDSPWIAYVDGHLVCCYTSAGRATEAAALASDMLRDHPPIEDAREPQPRWEAGQLAEFADLFVRLGNQDLAERFGREHAALQAMTR